VSKQQFYIKGLDYQPSADPIADFTGLQRDVPYFKQLGINVIRCYQTDYTLTHEKGMQLLADNGIYVMIDLSDPEFSIHSLGASWTTTMFNFFRLKAGAFAKYNNTLGYIIANEVVLPAGSTPAASFVKAATRDVKAWLKSQGHTKPVGYAAADVPEADDMQNYLDCASEEDSVDFYGVNIYRWCGESDIQKSGFADLVQKWANYRIPYLFSEFGCNTAGSRPFTEIAAMYGDQMTDVLSGGFVYEWHQEENNYGLVQLVSSTEVTLLPDFNNLKQQYAAINPKIANYDTYTPAPADLSNCPAVSSTWQAKSSPLPPTPNVNKCACAWNSLQCRISTNVYDPLSTPLAVRNSVGTAFDKTCKENNIAYCGSFAKNSATGVYGDYSDCNDFERLSIAIDARYKKLGGGADNCKFDGVPTEVVNPSTPASTDCLKAENSFPYNPPTPRESGTVEPNQYCASGLLPCGEGCYDPRDYCCQNRQLLPNSECDPNQSTQSYTAGEKSTSSTTQTPSTSAQATTGNANTGNANTGNANTGNTGVAGSSTVNDQPVNTVDRGQESSSEKIAAGCLALVLCVAVMW